MLVLIAMTVLAITAAGSHFVALRASRDSRDALRRARVLAAAEYGLYRSLDPAEWPPAWNTTAERGLLATRSYHLERGVVDTVRIWKLTTSSFFLTSEAMDGNGALSARRRLGVHLSLTAPGFAPMAPVTVREQLTIAGGSVISGADTPVSYWSCQEPADALPAIAIADASMVAASECGDTPCLTGSDELLATPLAAAAGVHERFGSVSRSELAARGVTLAAGTVIHAPSPTLDARGGCDSSDSRNLGDPLRVHGGRSPCADHVFVGHALGDLRVAGGAGQVLLVVDGDLELDAGVHLFGFAVVRGTLRLAGAARFVGAALASRVVMDGGSRIDHSRCALATALRAAALPAVPRGAAWVELH